MIESQKKFEKYISQLMRYDNSIISKNNLELLRQFYNYTLTKFENVEMSDLYLTSFKSISDITCSKIEENFSKILFKFIDAGFDYFDTIELEKYNNEYGVYFIFNNLNNLIYVGKSSNVGSRALQSFINKMPYGATYIKIIEFDNDVSYGMFEAIAIDYFMPLYNNKLEPFNLTHKTYSKLIKSIERILEKKELIYPSIKKLYYNIK